MSEVNPVGTRRHFGAEEEAALKRDESTSAIAQRGADKGVDIRGKDPTWRDVKERQQSLAENAWCLAFHAAHPANDARHFAGLEIHFKNHAVDVALGRAGLIGGTLAGVALAAHELHEAHVKANEQAKALVRDNVHVAVIGALDLPAGYKAVRLDVDYKGVAKGNQSPAFKMTERLMADTKGLATLQLHADRGMNAARDFTRSGLSVEAFLAAHPNVAAAYRDDAAFHEGFDAYVYAKTKLSETATKEVEQKLEERDGWYAQSQINLRM